MLKTQVHVFASTLKFGVVTNLRKITLKVFSIFRARPHFIQSKTNFVEQFLGATAAMSILFRKDVDYVTFVFNKI